MTDTTSEVDPDRKTPQTAATVEALLQQVLILRQAHGGPDITVTLPDVDAPTEADAREALYESFRLTSKLLLHDTEYAPALDAAPPAPLFALLGGLAGDSWQLPDDVQTGPQRRALAALLVLIELAAQTALDICSDAKNLDAARIISAGQVLAIDALGERYTYRMMAVTLQDAYRDYQAATSDEARDEAVRGVLADLPIILQRGATPLAPKEVHSFLADTTNDGRVKARHQANILTLALKAFRCQIERKTLENAMLKRGKER